jgi:hypothetical protein
VPGADRPGSVARGAGILVKLLDACRTPLAIASASAAFALTGLDAAIGIDARTIVGAALADWRS